jgi:pre-rRNA-processing protein TSR2
MTDPAPLPEAPSQQSAQQPENASPSAQLDLAITLILHSWPALSLAVQSSWGGPASADKRDWLCGAVSGLFVSRPETDAEDVEDVLMQVMNDEFDVVIEDGSAAEIAVRICHVRDEVGRGEYGTVRAMWEAWKAKGKMGGGDSTKMFRRVDVAGHEDQESDIDDDDDEEEEEACEDEDAHMEDAPAPVRTPWKRTEPEVDEEGFTKVVGWKKR